MTLAVGGHAATIVRDPADAAVVVHAAADLAGDIGAVSGARPTIVDRAPTQAGTVVIVGTLGHSRPVDALVAAGRLDVQALRGRWEGYRIVDVAAPLQGIARALVIVGSDRRGTAYGVYTLSRAIGVSPWTWWADVPPQHHAALYVRAGTAIADAPVVRYRGIFINDEDWGLHPWAAQTYEPEAGGIGPKTYRRVFELLLRLKANLLWPAMHAVSRPFYANPALPKLADDYAIVIGSSHAEPMLRDNVGEWTALPADFDYRHNRGGVLRYWRQRVAESAGHESIYTIGMRGVHDSAMQGGGSMDEQRALLESIFADQRRLLARDIDPDPAQVPQVFTPYKEVLDVYRHGLKVPDDVTIVWPDDNFGYLRELPDAAERRRSGGSGLYYHLSYLGAPLSYLWLGTTPPALIWNELRKADASDDRRLWVANVGDIKPSEIGISFFLAMAWNPRHYGPDAQPRFLRDWSRQTFGPSQADAIAALLDTHFRLNGVRKPEHLQWWLPGSLPKPSGWTPQHVARRLAAFDALISQLDAVQARVPPAQRDAFFELVGYPLRAAAAANRRYFDNERYQRDVATDPSAARCAAARALAADDEIKALTRRYNKQIAGGKWRHLMAVEPADGQWARFRLAPLRLPSPSLAGDVACARPSAAPSGEHGIVVEAEHYATRVDAEAVGWRLIEGLGHGRGAMSLLPLTREVPARAPQLRYRVDLPQASAWTLRVDLIPTFPLPGHDGLQLTVAVDGLPLQELDVRRRIGSRRWAQAVLAMRLPVDVQLPELSADAHKITLSSRDPSIAIDRIELRVR
nr:glycosyl hydrolase 115 family protein [Solimonas marina]